MTQTAVNEAAHGTATAIPSQVQAEKTASQERVDHFVSDVITAVREVMVRHDMQLRRVRRRQAVADRRRRGRRVAAVP